MARELNWETLRAALAASDAGWQAVSSPISDMPLEDFVRMLGYTPGPNEPTLADRELSARLNALGSPLLADAALAPGGAETAAAAEGLPASFDLRDVDGANYVTPVKSQGGCGSCVAFGTIAAVEGTLKYQLREPDLDVDLSEAQLFYCHGRDEGRNCDNGWWADRALGAVQRLGVTDERCFPYRAGDQECGTCADADTRLTFIDGWRRFVTPASMKSWLVDSGPLIACFSVYEDFRYVGDDVYRHVSGEFLGGHCVCIVGYDDSENCWIAKNSWGPAWATGGYFRIGYGEVGIDAEMWTVEGVRPPAGLRDATFVSQQLPAAVTPGERTTALVTMRNTGLQTWTAGRRYRLGSQAPQDNLTWATGRVEVPRPVPPWDEVTFTVPLTAPADLPARMQWQMLQEGVTWFGEKTPEVEVPRRGDAVRVGQVLKLRHLVSGRSLHSHPFAYGHLGSSGQQQVTCFEGADANDLWRVGGPDGSDTTPLYGQVVEHGDVVRLTHLSTGRNLHSHSGFPSPVTGQQEVTCFGSAGVGDGNDDWEVEVEGGGPWEAGKRVRLIHRLTNHALHSHIGYADPQWTLGQQEVTAFAGRDDNDLWSVTDLALRGAAFVSQSVPTTMVVGEQHDVEVVMANVGSSVWVPGQYRLGSQGPQDNLLWGLGRVDLTAPVAPGERATFRFRITAPTSPGSLRFRWQMLEEGVEWFGETSPDVRVDVFGQTGDTTVPYVVGRRRRDAQRLLDQAELVGRFLGRPAPLAEVLSQSPAEGTRVARGSTVTVVMDTEL